MSIRLAHTTFLFSVLLCIAAQAPAQQTGILCFGDSITAGINLDDPGAPRQTPESGYLPYLSTQLNAHWKPVSLTNQGIPGLKSYEAATIINGVLAGGGYGYVLIHIGANDVTLILRGELSAQQTVANVEYMVSVAKSRGVTPIISSLLPRYDGVSEDLVVRDINGGLKSVASAHGVTMADQYGNFYARSGIDLFSDPMHPSTAGYQAMAEEWAAAVSGASRGTIDLIAPIYEILDPAPNTTGVAPQPEIRVTIQEYGMGLDAASISLEVNGQSVQHHMGQSGSRTNVWYKPDAPFQLGETISVRIACQDLASPPNESIRNYSFTIVTGNGSGGDVDGSGEVDGVDLILLGASFGSAWGDSSYNPDADLDRNYIVDGVDLSILSFFFAK